MRITSASFDTNACIIMTWLRRFLYALESVESVLKEGPRLQLSLFELRRGDALP